MKVLVTGSSGLVGSAIKNISPDYPYDFIFVSSKDADLTDYMQTYRLFSKHKPDYVIHLAACVGGLFKNMNYKVDMFEKNTLINFNVVKYSHTFKVKKLVCCLSTCIFPDKTTYPINETMLHDGPPHSSNDAYAYAKRMLEIHCKTYQDQFDDNFICVIPTNIYGPNDNYNLEDGHVIPALTHRCYLAKKEGKPFRVLGSGTPLRQFIYSDDLAKLFMWTLENYNEKESLILSVGEKNEVAIKDIALEIAKSFDYEHMMEFDTRYSDGQYKKTADNTKLINLIGDFEFTRIDQGIRKNTEWFIKNFEDARK
jgi:GDP-L-fucose synthase